MTGADLHAELERAARAAGVGIRRFVAPLSNNPATFLDQLKQAIRPKPNTIARIRALLAGEAIPPGQQPPPGVVTCTRAERAARGLPPSQRMRRELSSLSLTAREKARVEQLRVFTEIAHVSRRPGQTIADRVRELRLESRQSPQPGFPVSQTIEGDCHAR